ncbi:tetratricopeptide repeat-containing sensor histidine kinase [Mucilaginibacter aquaedulcis]|uniref:tetratricopeptide repeat-containing sensor histidine kinase n=1 Tax=Mucilaginibacter aquaedulcis TaxID=1187081 RepID=UPI0025B2CEBA|nr:histidine kinase dimerization/phosphoacceptor domain -containing protein [Mucilaginibacter aquaedulcis]MDN3546749.1 histidine kinase dimerization/phosphoacceptor domain -containing protein [Mucilaginibacter aquaedulcis]
MSYGIEYKSNDGQAMRRVYLLFSLILLASTVLAQHTKNPIGIPRDSVPTEKLVQGLQNLPNDTNRVILLERIAGGYWRLNTKEGYATCIQYAEKADVLSKKLKYVPGHVEAVYLKCKAAAAACDIRTAKLLLYSAYGEAKIRLLIIIAEYYLYDDSCHKGNLDTSQEYGIWARKLADSANSRHWHDEAQIVLAKNYFIGNQLSLGQKNYLEIIGYYHRIGDKLKEADYWSKLGTTLPESDSTQGLKITYNLNAYNIYLHAGNEEDAAYSLRDVAEVNLHFNQADSALLRLLRILSIFQKLKKKVSLHTYSLISTAYYQKGDFRKSLDYENLALAAASNKDQAYTIVAYERMATIYEKIGFYKNALNYYKKVFDDEHKMGFPDVYYTAYQVVNMLLKLGRANEALAFLESIEREWFQFPLLVEAIHASYGNVYAYLKKTQLAERYYLQMLRDDKESQTELKKEISSVEHLTSPEAYLLYARFLMGEHRYKEAKIYLLKCSSTNYSREISEIAEEQHLLFKADSALGNFKSSLTHFLKYRAIKDSVLSQQSLNQLTEIQVENQVSKKEESIKLLQSQAKTRDGEVQKVSLQRNFTIIGIIVSLVIAYLIYHSYRLKNRSNIDLKIKQLEINTKNQMLEQLVADKDWLLKEVHHRVKNNLHMITSLLETQSSMLSNNAALDAIRESQDRIQAISLIHQRLYMAADIEMIEIRSYILELVQYFKYTYQTVQQNIRFTVNCVPSNFTVEQIVPLGLILNEAITNTIKYGFPEIIDAEISIDLSEVDGDLFRLEIADNGIGLPENFNADTAKSMGVSLMRGLSKQLRGTFQIFSDSGTKIFIVFKKINSEKNCRNKS